MESVDGVGDPTAFPMVFAFGAVGVDVRDVVFFEEIVGLFHFGLEVVIAEQGDSVAFFEHVCGGNESFGEVVGCEVFLCGENNFHAVLVGILNHKGGVPRGGGVEDVGVLKDEVACAPAAF